MQCAASGPDLRFQGACVPLPDNTAPMMTGQGQYGSLAMGGMFTTVKVRRDQKPGDYKDPGWFKHPAGSVAYEFKGELPAPARAQVATPAVQPKGMAKQEVEVQIRKPKGHTGH